MANKRVRPRYTKKKQKKYSRRNRAGMDKNPIDELSNLFSSTLFSVNKATANKVARQRRKLQSTISSIPNILLPKKGNRKSVRNRKPSRIAIEAAKNKEKQDKMRAATRKKRQELIKKKRVFDFSDLSKALDDIAKK